MQDNLSATSPRLQDRIWAGVTIFSQRSYGNKVYGEGHSRDSAPEEDSVSVRQ